MNDQKTAFCEDGEVQARIVVRRIKTHGADETTARADAQVELTSALKQALEKRHIRCEGRCLEDPNKQCMIVFDPPNLSDKIMCNFAIQFDPQTNTYKERWFCVFPRTVIDVFCSCEDVTGNA